METEVRLKHVVIAFAVYVAYLVFRHESFISYMSKSFGQ